MSQLPVIVGFGGINPAGRSSFHHGYRRMVIDALDSARADRTYRSLASVMGLDMSRGELTPEQREYILEHTLIRRIEDGLFDIEKVPFNKRMSIAGSGGELSFVTRARQLPDVIPEQWSVTDLGDGKVKVTMADACDVLMPSHRRIDVSTAGQLPSGFDPSKLYASRNHPRGLQMAIYGASDALGSMGIDWQTVMDAVHPDQIGVYASSAMAQLDDNGMGGLLMSRADGRRVSSKNLALGLADMPGDFVSAYVLGNVGTTAPSLGACATFFYNMRLAVNDIKAGNTRVAVVGVAEAGLDPRIIDGYTTMGALATDDGLLKLDAAKGLSEPDYRRSSRPFSSNCGFTISESAQFIVLFDDSLALELGAQIHSSVPDVFVNADGFKKSISGPGIGNYLTIAKTLAAAESILGSDSIRQRSFVQAHGTSTPQNRVTESHILNETAKVFGIEKWPVGAIKAYLGHSIGAASGDQLIASLGVWNENILAGIATIDHIAEDVHDSNLQLQAEHMHLEPGAMDLAVLNSKGFGGNNASAAVLSPTVSEKMLRGRHGNAAWTAYLDKREAAVEKAQAYDDKACSGDISAIYHFDHNVMNGDDVEMSREAIRLRGWKAGVELTKASPYAGWMKD
ncbi:3-oxoacyl-(acyl-carrier-protein) synthase [Spongiibacter sp. IMCC21906]|uniref:beta-ketoacyl synthase n=1 Tax=Spongiibacter sp. IMCC21906 TaxID=1620392 RepID=UPI00062DF769|nr:beta-ketoacyl synthase [Spongiibacter sp. IMCC21906]AKH70184.1 3-oxoacyl-(acyl-carrier-protein) synthase [Spongiibacter sp. IMCC21906]